MNSHASDELMQYRLQQARDSLKESRALHELALYRGAVNRAYYAMFYAVLALAVQRQEVTAKHSGAIAFFDREFVKAGIFPKELSRSLHFAFQKRQENDYGEIYSVSEEDARLAIRESQTFVDTIEQYLKSTNE